MRAVVFTGHGKSLEIRDIDPPEPTATGVTIETDACGICRSDWHAWQGDPLWKSRNFERGHVFGHEPAGTVVAVGDEVKTISEGDRVAVPFNLADGTCPTCRMGHSNLCDDRIPLGLTPESPGAFAEQFHVPWADFNVVPLSDGVSVLDMAGLGCRFMTAYHALINRAMLSPGDWVAVHGCGGVGLSVIHIADALGARVVAIDLFEEKLAFASDIGAAETINVQDVDDVAAEIRSITDGGADISIDALGIAETCINSITCLRTRGQHLQIGLTTNEEGGDIPIPTDRIVAKELTIIGSVGMPRPHYEKLFRLIEHGTLDPSVVITDRVSLDETPTVLESMSDYGTIGITVINSF